MNESIEISKNTQDILMVRDSYNIFGAIYFKQKYYDKAREYYQTSLVTGQNLPDFKQHQSFIFNNIGETYLYEGNYAEAKKWLLQALEIKQELNNESLVRSTLNLLGKAELEAGKPDEAIIYLEKSLEKASADIKDQEVAFGLSLAIKALNQGEEKQVDAAEKEKLSLYSQKLLHEYLQLEEQNKQIALQLTAEKHALATELEESEGKYQLTRNMMYISLLLLAALSILSLYIFKKWYYLRSVLFKMRDFIRT